MLSSSCTLFNFVIISIYGSLTKNDQKNKLIKNEFGLLSKLIFYFKLQPPSILTISPCMEASFPEANMRVNSAISAGSVQRPIGVS